MANVFGVHAVGQALVSLLRQAHPGSPLADTACEFRILSSGELASPEEMPTSVALYLYRMSPNAQVRNARPAAAAPARAVPLAVDLHYLLTVWSSSAQIEHALAAWAMQQFAMHPLLDASVLGAEAEWGPGDAVQVAVEDVATEDLMRIWDALEPPYRLSVPYVARMVRLELGPGPDRRVVVARRIGVGAEPA